MFPHVESRTPLRKHLLLVSNAQYRKLKVPHSSRPSQDPVILHKYQTLLQFSHISLNMNECENNLHEYFMSVWIKLYSSTHSLTPESKLGNGSCLFYSCQDQHEAHWVKTSMNFPRPNHMPDSPAGLVTDLASRKRERSIMTASQVLCFSCSSIAVNFRRMIDTIRSISLGAIGRVRLCSRSRFTTWLVNSLHACKQTPQVSQYIRLSLHSQPI